MGLVVGGWSKCFFLLRIHILNIFFLVGGGGGDWGLAGARVNDFFFHNESKSKIFFILWGVGDGGGWGCWWGQGGGG